MKKSKSGTTIHRVNRPGIKVSGPEKPARNPWKDPKKSKPKKR